MRGDVIDARAWQRELAARGTITVTKFEATRETLWVTVQATASANAIPVTLVARVSRDWHGLFEYTLEPHPIRTGRAAMDRLVDQLTEHATSLAYRTSLARDEHERRRMPARRRVR